MEVESSPGQKKQSIIPEMVLWYLPFLKTVLLQPWVPGWADSTVDMARWRSSSASDARVVAVVRWRASAPSRLAAALRAAGVAR